MADLVLADMRFAGSLRRVPLWTVWFVASAVLFVTGSLLFLVSGPARLAFPGLAGALAAVLVLLRFAGKNLPKGR